jgi:hypothetical protein
MFRKLALFMALGAGVSLPLANFAKAAVADGVVIGSHVQVLPVEKAQFFFGGRNYCWYDNGWQGPGFYWCGYAFRTGLGWGGGAGWHGWRRGGGGGGRPGIGRPGNGHGGGGRGRPGGGHGGGGGRPGGGHGGGGRPGGGHGGGGGHKP